MRPSDILAGHEARVAKLEEKIRDTKAEVRQKRLSILVGHDHIRQMYESAWEQADKILERDQAGSALRAQLRSLQDRINQENKTVVMELRRLLLPPPDAPSSPKSMSCSAEQCSSKIQAMEDAVVATGGDGIPGITNVQRDEDRQTPTTDHEQMPPVENQMTPTSDHQQTQLVDDEQAKTMTLQQTSTADHQRKQSMNHQQTKPADYQQTPTANHQQIQPMNCQEAQTTNHQQPQNTSLPLVAVNTRRKQLEFTSGVDSAENNSMVAQKLPTFKAINEGAHITPAQFGRIFTRYGHASLRDGTVYFRSCAMSAPHGVCGANASATRNTKGVAETGYPFFKGDRGFKMHMLHKHGFGMPITHSVDDYCTLEPVSHSDALLISQGSPPVKLVVVSDGVQTRTYGPNAEGTYANMAI